MTPGTPHEASAVLATSWLTARRLRAQALVLAACLWGVCTADFATPGLFDRAGNIKFQDFLPLYVSGRLVAQGRAGELYNQQVVAGEIEKIVHRTGGDGQLRVLLPNLYGPQVGLLFAPLSRLSFPIAAWIWSAVNLLAFFACVFVVWRVCPGLHPHARFVALSAIAFPPLFNFFVRGQTSVLVLICFAAAFLALRADRSWLAGMAFGLLVFKPQFLIAIPLLLLLAGAWKMLAGLSVSAAAQIAWTWAYFGGAVMRSYFDLLWHVPNWISSAELPFAAIQMHSWRSFWSLLIPWPQVAMLLYLLSSLVTIALAASVWKSASPLALRFSAVTLAVVLVNPHLFVYDLLVLTPALLLLAEWTLTNAQHRFSVTLRGLVYLAFILPLLGPLSLWTHFQLSVPAFAVLFWFLWRSVSAVLPESRDRRLASP